MQRFIIQGRLDSLNDYTKACRTNPYVGAKMKKDNESIVKLFIKQAKLQKVEKYPVKVKIDWYEKDKRRDIDGITFATKFILDSLVELEIIEDDSQKYVCELEHNVHVCKQNPRIEVFLIEGDKQ